MTWYGWKTTTAGRIPPESCGGRAVSAPRALVTGAGGFVGSWLVPELAGQGWNVLGCRKPGVPSPDLDCDWIDVDLRERTEVARVLARARPQWVAHLAALAVPREAARERLETLRLNVLAVDHLLRAVAAHVPGARVLLVSSGEVYGHRGELAAASREGDPVQPMNPYAASKAAAEALACAVTRREGLDLIRVRPFNHTGPGRPAQYAESGFACQIAAIERGEQAPVVRVGNLDAVRDLSDVRDVVRAYRLLLERAAGGEVFNVSSGRARTMREVLDLLLAHAESELRVERDPTRYEAHPASRIASVGCAEKLRALGWEPRFELDRTLADLLDYWRAAS